MTSRERWLAAINMQEVDRLPFWPKLDAAYPRAQREPFSSMTIDQIHDWIGSDKHIWVPRIVRESRTHSSTEDTEKDGVRRIVYTTRSGSTEARMHWDTVSQSHHPVVFPVKDLDEIRVMTEWYSDCRIELDEQRLEDARDLAKQVGEGGVTASPLGKSPLMHFVEWLAGVENAHYFLADYPDEVEALFAAIQNVLLQVVQVYADHSPVDLHYFIENTSTTLISPDQYHRYCFPHVREYAAMLRSRDRLFVLHMCGHLRALLPELAQTGAHAFEAFTSPPVGNTTLLDGRTACPNTCLVGGTSAVLWIRPAREIVSDVEASLNALPHHRGVVVTSAGVMPPLCRPETIREVCDRVKQYSLN
jgi:hypothetical protein